VFLTSQAFKHPSWKNFLHCLHCFNSSVSSSYSKQIAQSLSSPSFSSYLGLSYSFLSSGLSLSFSRAPSLTLSIPLSRIRFVSVIVSLLGMRSSSS